MEPLGACTSLHFVPEPLSRMVRYIRALCRDVLTEHFVLPMPVRQGCPVPALLAFKYGQRSFKSPVPRAAWCQNSSTRCLRWNRVSCLVMRIGHLTMGLVLPLGRCLPVPVGFSLFLSEREAITLGLAKLKVKDRVPWERVKCYP